jgi:arylsulfatase A-like enzyme
MDCAGIEQPPQLPGRSLLPLAMGQGVDRWRKYLVSENNMVQTGRVDGFRPTMEGRMVRTDQYKYCLYSRGNQREALYDMQRDPLETVNRAGDPKYRDVLLEHRRLLRGFAAAHHDPLAAELLADDVGPRPFVPK